MFGMIMYDTRNAKMQILLHVPMWFAIERLLLSLSNSNLTLRQP